MGLSNGWKITPMDAKTIILQRSRISSIAGMSLYYSSSSSEEDSSSDDDSSGGENEDDSSENKQEY